MFPESVSVHRVGWFEVRRKGDRHHVHDGGETEKDRASKMNHRLRNRKLDKTDTKQVVSHLPVFPPPGLGWSKAIGRLSTGP